jgi:hypothetical protein
MLWYKKHVQDVAFLGAVTGENDGTIISEAFSSFCMWVSLLKNLNIK